MRTRLLQNLGMTGALALLLFASPPPVEAQDGRVTGRVTEGTTGRPLAGAQISVQGTTIGGLSNAQGTFLLLSVPSGQQTVQVQLVGFGRSEETVNIPAGGTATVNFELRETAIELGEIVVSGTGVATERRKLGNTIATINAEGLQTQAVTSFSEMLQGREPGVVGLPTSGLAGEGTRIRIRGSASLSQSNEPLVYIDGVRVDRGGGFGEGAGAGGAGTPSRLDDINPDAIERIEILKGAAAATLFGTEASNGVIQIFTKSGREGAPRFTFQAEGGLTDIPTNRLIPHANWARDQEDIDRIQRRWGLNVQPFEVFEVNMLGEAFETGYNTNFSGSVSGGSGAVTYFASGRYQWEDGAFGLEDLGPARDNNTRIQASATLNIFPVDRLRIRLSTQYSEVDHETPNNSNNIYAPFPLIYHSQPRFADRETNFFGSPVFATTREALFRQTQQEAQHFNGTFNANFQIAEGINLDGTFGLDMVNQRSFEHVPFGWNVDAFTTANVAGQRELSDRNHTEVTVDLKGSWEDQFGDNFTSSFVIGGQGFITQNVESGGFAFDFPGPGFEVVGAGANQTVFENILEVVNAGVFAQEQIGFRDYLFLTVGGRLDANSAFGEEFDAVFYPKASVSLMPTQAFGWDSDTFSTIRVRAAIGQSGLQPGAFDQLTTFGSQSSVVGAGIVPDNLGNPALKPEISTEWEVGGELGLFNDRASIDVTYWDRTVEDALVARQFPVTGGFRRPQLDNIAEIKAHGVEIGLNGSVIEGRRFSLDLFANAAYLQEEVSDLGGAPPIKVGGSYPRYRNFIIEGEAPGVFLGAVLQDVPIPLDIANNCAQPSQADALAFFSQPRTPDDFEVLPVACGSPDFLLQKLGKPTPDWQGSFGADISFLNNFQLASMFEFQGGNFHVQDLSGAFRNSHALIGRNTPATARIASTLQNPASTAQERLDAAIEWAQNYRSLAPMSGMHFIQPADFLRFRELSLTYFVPGSVTQGIGFDDMSITLSGRNLALWVNDEYTGLDPETNDQGRCSVGEQGSLQAGVDCNFQSSIEAWGVPIPRRYSLRVRVGF